MQRLDRDKIVARDRFQFRRRPIEWQIQDLLKFDDVIDFGPHGDVGDPFQNELDHYRHAVLDHQLARLRKSRLSIPWISDTDRLAAEALCDSNVVNAINTKLWRIDVLERQLHV